MKSEHSYEDVCAEIWKTLSKINVNEHTEKKNNLTYLSWAWAYQSVMDVYPTFSYEVLPNEEHNPGLTVWIKGSITLHGRTVSKTMYLPVLDYKNQPIANPNPFQINTARQRCLAKCISMFGLGAYIYAGEDLPQEAEVEMAVPKAAQKATKKVAKKKVAKKTAAKSEAEETAESVTDDLTSIEDEAGAIGLTDTMIELASMMETRAGLIDFWRKNAKAIDLLDSEYGEQYNRLKEAFSQFKSQMAE